MHPDRKRSEMNTDRPLSPSPSPSPSITSSTSSRYYSSTSTPYPVVFSNPSLIDSERSSVHSSQNRQPQHSPPLYSSPFNSPAITARQPALDDPLSATAADPQLSTDSITTTNATTTITTETPMSEPLPSLAQPHAQAPMAATVTMTTGGPVNNEVEANGAQTDNTISNVSRPRSVVDFAIDSVNTNPGGRRVRRNMLSRMSHRWHNVPRDSRIILSLSTSMSITKITATIAVLIVDKDADCLFLKVLLILYTVRSLFGLPFTIYARLHPRVQGAPPTPRDILLDRQRTMMEIAGTCLFFMSNYFLFTQGDCRQEAPAVFYMTVVHIILGYIVILIPILLCLAVILCLPLVLRVMRALDLGPNLGVKGATEEMIAAIPIVRYRKPVESEAQISQNTVIEIGGAETGAGTGSETEADSVQGAGDIGAGVNQPAAGVPNPSTTTAVSSATAPSTPRRSKGDIFGFFRRSKKGSLNGSGKAADVSSPDANTVEYLTLSDPQDAICAICLCDYEDEEELRKMKCLHYFHKDCVDEWLRLHRNCPLCKRDIEELSGPRSPATEESTPVADTSHPPSTATSSRRIQSEPEPVLVTIPYPQR